jgi:hypothetical protein
MTMDEVWQVLALKYAERNARMLAGAAMESDA